MFSSKRLYEVPDTEVFSVVIEQCILSGKNNSIESVSRGSQSLNDDDFE